MAPEEETGPLIPPGPARAVTAAAGGGGVVGREREGGRRGSAAGLRLFDSPGGCCGRGEVREQPQAGRGRCQRAGGRHGMRRPAGWAGLGAPALPAAKFSSA